MKQKDLAVIIIVVFISGILSFFISNMFFALPKQKVQKVEVVAPITPDFPVPDSKYFNNNSIDPTQIIHISGNNNQAPFNTK